MEVFPRLKILTHQFICFGTAELTILMFCKDKIAKLVAASKNNKPVKTSTNSHFLHNGHLSTAAAFFCPHEGVVEIEVQQKQEITCIH